MRLRVSLVAIRDCSKNRKTFQNLILKNNKPYSKNETII